MSAAPSVTDPPAAAARPGKVDGVAPSATAAADGPSSAAPETGSDEFLEAVRGELPAVAMDRRGEEITELGGQACASLAAGHDRGEAAAELTEFGLAADDARRLVKLARTTLCQG